MEVTSHMLAHLIVQNNHPTINSNMRNNFNANLNTTLDAFSGTQCNVYSFVLMVQAALALYKQTCTLV